MKENEDPAIEKRSFGCTFVIHCDDLGKDVWEDQEGFLIQKKGHTLQRSAEFYASVHRFFLFEMHRKRCPGPNQRKHSITLRVEVENFSHILYVPLGVDYWIPKRIRRQFGR